MQSNSATPAPAVPATARRARSRLRWTIITLSGLGLAIAYLDRSALSVASTYMQDDLGFDQTTKGILLSSFFWTYAIFQLPSGWLLDRFGPRLIYPIAVVWWSLWTAATALAHGVGTLLLTRLGLGIGEAPVQPANIKVVATWFPRRERALASSLFDTGQQVGVALSVPVVTALIAAFGWRAAFVVIGLAGMVWVIGWWMIYRSPREHPRISQAELDYIEGGDAAVPETGPRVRWVELLRYPPSGGWCSATSAARRPARSSSRGTRATWSRTAASRSWSWACSARSRRCSRWAPRSRAARSPTGWYAAASPSPAPASCPSSPACCWPRRSR